MFRNVLSFFSVPVFVFFIVLVIEGVWQGTVNGEADLLS